MFLSIPALKEVVINAISERMRVPRDTVKKVLESDGPWTDHDRFLTNTFMTAKQRSEDLGIDLTQIESDDPIGLEVSTGREASLRRSEKLVEISKETGQPLETVKAIHTAYFEFIENVTSMIKKKLGGSDSP